jgi:hypothetical protein
MRCSSCSSSSSSSSSSKADVQQCSSAK